MRQSIRRQLLVLRAYAILSSLALIVLSAAAFRQAAVATRLDELTVQRLNVVDANGTLRMVLAGTVIRREPSAVQHNARGPVG